MQSVHEEKKQVGDMEYEMVVISNRVIGEGVGEQEAL